MDPTKEQRRLCCPSGQEKSPPRGSGLVGKGCFKGLEIFLAALCFVYFAKALAGSYLKSTITQIERRFDIPSSLVGVIDGSFEIGNLLVILLVSYFGARLHRPKIIGTGCLIMAAGTFLIAMPHFFMGRYSYERPLVHSANSSINVSPCAQDSRDPKFIPSENPHRNLGTGCEKDLGNSMWVYILLGNLLRGVGEAPIQPLGISYIDDYTSEDNTAFYIGCVQTSAVIGPIFGFLLGSLCAKLFVDIGSVNLDSVTITPADAHWVGAWWLGYLIAGGISILATIPFWFLPKEQPRAEMHKNSGTSSEQSRFILEEQNEANTEQDQVHLLNMVKDFLPSVKDLLGNPVYFLYLCGSVFQYNSLIGMVTYKPKYIEQQYGQTSSKTNFLIGLINIPAVALGIFSGGVIMKRFRINILGAAKLLLGPSLLGYLMLFSLFAMGCKNSSMAGLTVSYQGSAQISNQENGVSECNVGCRCPLSHWDPVCGENGLTYYSACFAGCSVSSATGKRAEFYNCSCVGAPASHSGGGSAVAGSCAKGRDCSKMFLYFVVMSVMTSFALSLGGTPGYMLLLRCIKPELKSFALGIYTLVIRVLAGIPAPMYLGALIDTVCLKWSSKNCSGRGACRFYNMDAFRYIYLGMTLALGTVFIFMTAAVVLMVQKRFHPTENKAADGRCTGSALPQNGNLVSNLNLLQTTYWAHKETRL
ncbi:solute carrier organic anion transporter family member 1C1 [Xenopus laevis]|uniref:Solute carrier organic anion transporter family member n=1 Tax=Xenopus laevis TaxID=8355 RepID=A0A8J1MKY8_XENLA|nr:solute carrier organic anion transporter family member 1C1 [Xenopus laevis]